MAGTQLSGELLDPSSWSAGKDPSLLGAASLLAANLVYNSEPKDGTAIVNASSGLAMLQLLGKEGVSFDAARFQ